LWLFPQGAEQAAGIEPMDFKPGSARLALRTGVRVVPMAFRYEFEGIDKPSIYVAMGPVLQKQQIVSAEELGKDSELVKATMVEHRDAVAAQWQRIHEHLVAHPRYGERAQHG